MNIQIIKRDKTLETYDILKIENVLKLAFKNSSTTYEDQKFSDMVQCIDKQIKEYYTKNDLIYIEDIQDIVEKTLMIYEFYTTAKHYIQYRFNRNEKRKTESYISKIPDNVITPWGMLGYITYKRTYARRLNDNDPDKTEEFRDTILRILDACQKQLHVGFTNEELKKAYYYFMSLKCSVAGRFLWQLGTSTVDKLGLLSLQNCAFINIDEPIGPFLWVFDCLMLGTGVGINVQKKYIDKIPVVIDKNINILRVDTKDADFIVPDSREGWIALLEKVLEAYFIKGKSFTYSTVLIRSAGSLIKGFGGTASGPEDLVKGINNIQNILKNKQGKHVSSVDCLDIVNIIGTIVVAGNVRRCLPKGSLVHTNLGLIPIENIKINNKVLTSSGYENVLDVLNQGVQNIITIITEDGEFKCTLNHRMAVYISHDKYEWKMAKYLTKNDLLITSRDPILGTQTALLPSNELIIPELDADIAWMLGLLYNTITIDLLDSKIYSKVVELLKRFGIEDKSMYDKIYTYINNSTSFDEIYDFIKEGYLDIRLGFIAGIIDGYNSLDNDILCSFSSKKLVLNIQTLCYSCGIETTLINNSINCFELKLKTERSKCIVSLIPQLNKKIKFIEDFNQQLYISKVIDILDNNESVETYDISVDNKHEFFCNGYLTHNSAIICMGDTNDIEYLNAKRWDLGNIPNWRCMSNNSVICNDILELPEEFWYGYQGNGEPYGLLNIDLSKRVGRIKDGTKYPDPDVEGYNPCGEQTLCNAETCCLSEIFLPNVNSYDELKGIITTVYRICKHSLLLKCHLENTEEIVHKNMRMGIGITGYMQCSQEQKDWLDPLYDYIREFDKEYSKSIGVNHSIKLTTCKPSGTLSILPGVTPGCHPGIFQYFIRRIRISSGNSLIKLCKKHGYKIEYQRNFDGTDDKNTMIVEFPCCYPEGTVLANNMNAIEQLETIKHLQYSWSDNAVSVTVYYKKEELNDIREWLRINYNYNIKSVSFLLHNDHGFQQAPYEEISKELYDELIKKVTPITSGNIEMVDDDYSNETCKSGACPIK